ncbi:MAG: ABC transporter permease [Candidatus Delongbacteria bacterium]|nr:ABC transporter permease [Candidatus Delongbacteria bacterium]MCG2761323.1 ABC transporter permease [Candidatus Delongbacteria bacterium]
MLGKIKTITVREYKATVKTKTFLISMIIVPIFMFAGLIVMKLFGDSVDTTDKNISVIDRSGIVAESLVRIAEERNKDEVYETKDNGELKKIKPKYIFNIIAPDDENPDKQRYQLSEKVRNKEIFSFVEIGKNVLHPKNASSDESDFSNVIRYYAEGAALDDIRIWVGNPLNNEIRKLRMKEAGIDPGQVTELMQWVTVNGMGLYSVDPYTGEYIEAKESSEGEAIFAPLIMMMIMFILSLLGAQPLLNSTMEEKSQKISEVILGSCSTFDFMMGKILGGVGASLSAALVYVGGGVIALKYMDRSDLIPLDLIPWFFAYATLLITMMGAIMAALGSTCSTAKEAQSLAFPGMLPMIIPMAIWIMIVREPMSNFSTIASLIPPLTPMLMLLRQSTPYHIPAWQTWTGLFGVIIFTLFTVWASARIFRIGILSSGKAPKIGTIIKWVFRND